MPMGHFPVPISDMGDGNWEMAHWHTVPVFPAVMRRMQADNIGVAAGPTRGGADPALNGFRASTHSMDSR